MAKVIENLHDRVALNEPDERCEIGRARRLPFGDEAIDRFVALQQEIFEGKTLSGDSAELIRLTRESRQSP